MKSGFYVGWNETLQKQGEVEPANVKGARSGRICASKLWSKAASLEPLVKPSGGFYVAQGRPRKSCQWQVLSGAGELTACWHEPFSKYERSCANVKTRRNERKAAKLYCSEVQGFEPLVKPSSGFYVGWNKTLQKQGEVEPANVKGARSGFTLAEVLLTLAVIGIVAAITLPSLMVDTTEKAFDAQRKALHARLAQAIGTMANLSGYGEYVVDATGDTTADTAAETFLYEGLSKVYKMNNICGYDSADTESSTVLTKCNIPTSITAMNGDSISFPTKLSELNDKLINNGKWGVDSDKSTTDTKVAAFETINGESIAVFYNLNCKNDADVGPNVGNYTGANEGKTYDWFYVQNRMCVNFIYDLNGPKGPNKVGKDIGFITALYAKNPEVVAPMPFLTDVDTTTYTQQNAIDKCLAFSDDSRLPNKHELTSMFYNMNLVGNFNSSHYWSSSAVSSLYSWDQNFNSGSRGRALRSDLHYVRCIRK